MPIETIDQSAETASAANAIPGTTSDSPTNPAAPAGSVGKENLQGRTRVWRVLAVFGAVALLAGFAWSRVKPTEKVTVGPRLTHTVTRGDLIITVTEQGTLESEESLEIKCKVRGENTVIWVTENGASVKEGDELVRLDTLAIDDAINERSKYALWSLSGAEQAGANARRSAIAIKEYLEGRYVTQLKTLEKDLAIAESNLRTEQNMLSHTNRMSERGYVSELDVEEREFAVEQAKLTVAARESDIEVLKKFTKAEELERLKGDLKAAEANQASLEERAKMDGTRRDLALAELELCIIKAPKDGMVIYPSAKAWERKPDIEEGATVHRDQTLLLMPDLKHMQVKVGIHESIIDSIKPGMRTNVTLPEHNLTGKVSSVASVARPAGWWTGNIVKYDTIVGLPSIPGLRPGMSAEVEIILSEHFDVLTVPVAAVLETVEGSLCWVTDEKGTEKRVLEIAGSNDVFMVVANGLEEGEVVVLNPRASIEDARLATLVGDESDESDERAGGPEAAEDTQATVDKSSKTAEKSSNKPAADSSGKAK